ncbi:MAG: 3-hydroxyacyl-ACP dehydratase FabZ family protein [Planctomycetaceae bacterium]
MRWFWIDRFIEFDSGKSAKAIKNVSLAEEHLHDHYPGFPVMPGSLMLEGMAQTAGILLGETHGFKHIVILAKVPKVIYHSWAVPGDTLIYSAELLEARPEGGITRVNATCTGPDGAQRLVAEAEIVFAHVDQSSGAAIPANVDQKNFVFELGLMSILDIGKAGDGTAAAAAE